MKKLVRTEFGNPLLRQTARQLTPKEITSTKIETLLRDMRQLLTNEKLGVGLAAPQIGEAMALAVIAIHPLQHRKKVKEFDLDLINPSVLQTFGRRVQMWEGCISAGPARSSLFAKVPRYKKVRIRYYDVTGKRHTKTLEGLAAHVAQHEIDHLNGVLFVDRVKDTKTFATYKEYLRQVKAEQAKKKRSRR